MERKESMNQNFEVGRGRAMSATVKGNGQMRVITVPTADEQNRYRAAADHLKQACDAAYMARLSEKADRAAELLERVAARKRAERLEGPDTTLGPSAGQLAEQWRRDYAARAAQLCAESEAAYAARNPHKKEDRQ